MNNVSLIGRLTSDPSQQMANTQNGQMEVAKFRLAVNRSQKGEADFISCTAFGKTAETINKYCKKGQQIGVNGRIQTGVYENKEGKKVYTTDVIVERMHFCGSSKDDGGAESSGDFNNIPDDVNDEGLPFK